MAETIYRFVSDVCYVKELIRDNTLPFFRPETFNDPFDCKTFLSDKPVQKQAFEDWCELSGQAAYKGMFPKITPEFQRATWGQYEAALKEMANALYICCFTREKYDILMWSHYANKHKGFCLEFSVVHLIKDDDFQPHEVEYEGYPSFEEQIELLKKIDGKGRALIIKVLSDVWAGRDPDFAGVRGELRYSDFFRPFLLRKSKHWKYESELRAIMQSNDGKDMIKPKIPAGALTGITFGCQCPDEQVDEIKALAAKRNPSINFRKAVESRREYSLEIHDIQA